MLCARVKCLSMLTAMLDDNFRATNANIDHDSFMELSFAPGADVSWLAMDPNISDLQSGQEPAFSNAGSSSSEQDSDGDSDTSEVHPCLKIPEDM